MYSIDYYRSLHIAILGAYECILQAIMVAIEHFEDHTIRPYVADMQEVVTNDITNLIKG